MDIGVRELRDSLSRHLATVREGHTITVTDHGRPVARIVPVDVPNNRERLIAEGKIVPAPKRKGRRSRPVEPVGGTVSDLVDEQRR